MISNEILISTIRAEHDCGVMMTTVFEFKNALLSEGYTKGWAAHEKTIREIKTNRRKLIMVRMCKLIDELYDEIWTIKKEIEERKNAQNNIQS